MSDRESHHHDLPSRRLIAVQPLMPQDDQRTRFLWYTGKRCNLDCSYCDHHDRVSSYVPFEQFEKAAQIIRREFCDRSVELVLTGGEPALHPRFNEIIRLLKEEGQINYLGCMTNGMRPLDFFIDAMKWLDLLIVSYQIENPQREKVLQVIEGLHAHLTSLSEANRRWLHVQIMVVPGELEHVKQVADRLRAQQIPCTLRRIRPLLHKSSLKSAPRFVPAYTSPLLADGHLDPDLGHNEDIEVPYYSELELKTLKEWETEWGSVGNFYQVESIYEVTQNGKTELIREKQNINDAIMRRENTYKGWYCWAGNQSIYIFDDGRVFAGTCQAKQIGTLDSGFTLEKAPLICPIQWCRCGTDLKITRFHPDGESMVRRPRP